MDVASLHLSDEVLELLRSGKINNRLLCEMMTHPRFRQLMADMEIVVDRIADMRIQDMNTVLEVARQKVMKEYAPDEMDVYMRTLEVAQINETDYFSHIIHEDMDDAKKPSFEAACILNERMEPATLHIGDKQ